MIGPLGALAAAVVAAGLLSACDAVVSVPLAAPVLAVAAEPLEEGPAEAAVVFVTPSAKPLAPKPKPLPIVHKEPPRPTGPSPAQLAADRELERVRADTSAIAAAEAQLRAAEAEARAAAGPIEVELRAAERKLQELTMMLGIESEQVRQNKCCSVCGNSKTEIESKGEPFAKHLTNVKGTVSECKPGKLQAVQRKYEGPIAAARNRVSEVKAKAGPAVAAAQSKVAAAKGAVDQAKAEQARKIQEAEAKVQALKH